MLRVTQRAMVKAIRRRTRVTDLARCRLLGIFYVLLVAQLKWQWAERIAKRTERRRTNDIKHIAGSRWIQATQNRGIRNRYKIPMSSSGCLSVDMMMNIRG
ncbi:jg16841 [Pararge aegeria aegeria]|uniref:Jg16841 protein n=1 Tax=Pararge aegeria aegeria TaxID=348720 RepID=A0A8S4SAY2_9NEOP|nr:jg16841 [Pararge aegeria aegeria]